MTFDPESLRISNNYWSNSNANTDSVNKRQVTRWVAGCFSYGSKFTWFGPRNFNCTWVAWQPRAIYQSHENCVPLTCDFKAARITINHIIMNPVEVIDEEKRGHIKAPFMETKIIWIKHDELHHSCIETTPSYQKWKRETRIWNQKVNSNLMTGRSKTPRWPIKLRTRFGVTWSNSTVRSPWSQRLAISINADRRWWFQAGR